MADLILEPYSVEQRWSVEGRKVEWGALIGEYLEAIARRCENEKAAVVGHLKALALLPDGGYLRVSAVGGGAPTTRDGTVPPGCKELTVVLNVIVYGIRQNVLARFVREAIAEVTGKGKGDVMIEEA